MKQATCHPEKPYYCKGLCRNCYERHLRETNSKYLERQRESSRRWHKENKEYKKEWDKKYRLLNPKDKDERYFQSLKNVYGISKEYYFELLEKCKNKCFICGSSPYEGKRLHLDHSHLTGEVRGLLCSRCNWYLHKVEKEPAILEKIKNYLKL